MNSFIRSIRARLALFLINLGAQINGTRIAVGNSYVNIAEGEFTEYYAAVPKESVRIISSLKEALALQHSYINVTSRNVTGDKYDECEREIRVGITRLAGIFGIRVVCDQVGHGITAEEIAAILEDAKYRVKTVAEEKAAYLGSGSFDGSEMSFGFLDVFDKKMRSIIEEAATKLMHPVL